MGMDMSQPIYRERLEGKRQRDRVVVVMYL